MQEEIDRQTLVDQEHLKLLAWGFIISGAISALFSLFGMIYLVIGLVMSVVLSHVQASHGNPGIPPAFVGWIFTGMGLVFFLLAMSVAIAKFWAAHCIWQRKSKIYCMVIAALGCLEFPYGTALGILSFIVLGRESVAKQFETR